MDPTLFPLKDNIVGRGQQERLLNQRGLVIWMTGLSGSGKSTIALGLRKRLFDRGYFTKVLDGDTVRSGINHDLMFSSEDRMENIRRVAEIAKLMADEGIIVICSFISPTAAIRDVAKEIIGDADFHEIFIDAPLEICEERDVKGLYRRARNGEIKEFTGISSPFEKPEQPLLRLDTLQLTVQESVSQLEGLIVKKLQL